jgi:hypothetical protein
MANKKEVLSLRLTEQFVKKYISRINDMLYTYKCEARKIFREHYEKPEGIDILDVPFGLSAPVLSINGAKYSLVKNRNGCYRGQFLLFDSSKDAEKYLSPIPEISDLNKVIEEQFEKIGKKLLSLADSVLLQDAENRKPMLEKLIKEVENAESSIIEDVSTIFYAFERGTLKPKNNC